MKAKKEKETVKNVNDSPSFPNLMKKLHYTSKKLNKSKIGNIQSYTHRHIIVKLLKAKEKAKTLKATKEKSLIIYSKQQWD